MENLAATIEHSFFEHTFETHNLSDYEKLTWLQLLRSENVGPITFFELIARYRTAEKALQALPNLARRGGRGRPLKVYPKFDAEQELLAYDKVGARLIGICEPEYPSLLKKIPDAPPLISVLGNVHLLDKKSISIVGARNASANGRRFAAKISQDLGEREFVITSGLARGMDAAAHTAALETGTIAVLGGGVDVIYPQENEKLYHAIKEQGAIVSEMPLGTQPQARHFPRRNRIISGISMGVLVVEAANNSGSLITARYALEHGREVFAVPGSPVDPRCRGTNFLIKQGATLTESAADIVDNLKPMTQISKWREQEEDLFVATFVQEPASEDIDRHREDILQLLSATAVHVDEVIRQADLPPNIVMTVILELELAGKIERSAGNKISLIEELEG